MIFLISKNRPVTLVITGALLIFSVLPFRKLNWALTFIPEKFLSLFSVFFTKAHAVFIIVLIIGIVLMGTGLTFKIFGWNMKFNKDSSEEEISKKNSFKKRKK